MNWRNVRLICLREVRDQLRDRRTLFMIFVLPVLLYPLLGMSLFQVAQFVREQPTRILVAGADSLPESPVLIEDGKFAAGWFTDVDKADLLHVEVDERSWIDDGKNGESIQAAKKLVADQQYEAVVLVPHDFASQLKAFRERLKRSTASSSSENRDDDEPKVPSPEIVFSTAKEKSQLAYLRVSRVLQNWSDEIVRQNLVDSRVPESAVKPFAVAEYDVAEKEQRSAAVWSKILPFLLLIWAMTGAFYPAIDLCAGEKERGTLETLLTSPAQRSEIVWGKLLTIMLFSVATAALNIASIGFTGSAVSAHLPELGQPPAMAIVWLSLALIPMSAMFSALCLALAAFARSSKEGQYYLMPLMLVTLPLVVLPMAPGVELNLGNSLIPVTGVMLLMRSMLEGDYLLALPYVPPVLLVTAVCCLLAIRWAIDQFNSESVLFRESERFDFGLWIRHVLRDRGDTPSAAAAVACGLLILMLRFFMSLAQPEPHSFDALAKSAVVGLLAVVLTPALLMTVMMTRSPVKTLQLRRPAWLSLPAMIVLAVSLHPLVVRLSHVVRDLYPVDHRLTEKIEKLITQSPSIWLLIGCFALAPAICEELAYRGFILSGMRRVGRKWRAIVITSILFGAAHGFVQQSIMATMTGMVLGYIAIQTGSIFPGMIYHACHNTLPLLMMQIDADLLTKQPWLTWLGEFHEERGFELHLYVAVLAAAVAILILRWLHQLPYSRSQEEALEESLHQPLVHPAAMS